MHHPSSLSITHHPFLSPIIPFHHPSSISITHHPFPSPIIPFYHPSSLSIILYPFPSPLSPFNASPFVPFHHLHPPFNFPLQASVTSLLISPLCYILGSFCPQNFVVNIVNIHKWESHKSYVVSGT